VPVQAFLVIRPASGNPQLPQTPGADPYATAAFPNATVIQLADYDFGVANDVTIGSTAAGAGAAKTKLNQLVVHKFADVTSPALFAVSAAGQHFAAVQIYVRHTGGAGPTPPPFLAYEFQTVFVSKIDWSATTGDDLSEEVTFVYGALVLAFQNTNPDGSNQGPVVRSSWSQITNSGGVADTIALP
jgi:type VI protein secretion system component Hcp